MAKPWSIRLTACHGTQLTEEERAAGENAAWAVFAKAAIGPAVAHRAHEMACDGITGEETIRMAGVWLQAEWSAITAATAGWWQRPEDLVLEFEPSPRFVPYDDGCYTADACNGAL